VARDDKRLLLLRPRTDQLLVTVILNWAHAVAAKLNAND
jgi:hypothetical protein